MLVSWCHSPEETAIGCWSGPLQISCSFIKGTGKVHRSSFRRSEYFCNTDSASHTSRKYLIGEGETMGSVLGCATITTMDGWIFCSEMAPAQRSTPKDDPAKTVATSGNRPLPPKERRHIWKCNTEKAGLPGRANGMGVGHRDYDNDAWGKTLCHRLWRENSSTTQRRRHISDCGNGTAVLVASGCPQRGMGRP